MKGSWQVPAEARGVIDIRLAEPLLDDAMPVLLEGGAVPGRRVVILDDGVPGHWEHRLRLHLHRHGVKTHFHIVPGGRHAVSMDTVVTVLDVLRRFGLDRRNEPILAVGGRAVLDAAAFAAGLYRRGVPFVRIPTSLLGYVWVSARTRVGVPLDGVPGVLEGRAAPQRVLLDREFFDTLSPHAFAGGLAAILRLALGAAPDLFELLEADAETLVQNRLRDEVGWAVLRRATDVMMEVLSADPFERRPLPGLVLGESFSAAFEAVGASGPAGAVGLDLSLATLLAVGRGWLDESAAHRVVDLCRRLGLRAAVPDADLMTADAFRKAGRGRARPALPRAIGAAAFVGDLTPPELSAGLRELRVLFRDDRVSTSAGGRRRGTQSTA